MNRRDLLEALAAGLLLQHPRARRVRHPRPPRSPWSFRLDRNARWSLATRDARTVVGGAEIAVVLAGGAAIPLAALERSRRFRLADAQGGNAGWQVVGVVAGVEVSAQFLDGPPPLITVSARGLEDPRRLQEIRFFDTLRADIPALSGGSVAWINGYRSSDPCRLVALEPHVEATSHWHLAILPGRAAHPTAFAFGVEDAGEGRFDCAAARVTAASFFQGRAVSAAHPPAAATLAIVPDTDPLGALARLVGPVRALPRQVPTGWSPRPRSASATEDSVLNDLEQAGVAFRPGEARVVRLDDGYQRAIGDWETNDRFPHGHRWLTDQMHASGFQAGLWLTPFLVAEASGIPAAHPDWLLTTPDRDPLLVDERAEWGGKVYALDAAQAPVREYLRDLVRHAVLEWGYDLLTLDKLAYGAAGVHEGLGMSGAEACRAALRAMREGAGEAFLIASDVPLQHVAGQADAVRVSAGEGAGVGPLHEAAAALALRAHYHGAAWLDDPGDLVVGEPLSRDEARLWATIVAVAGGPDFWAGAPDSLAAGRLELVKRTLPVAPLVSRAFDLAVESSARTSFPEWMLGRVADDWWILAAFNWGERPRRLSLSLADHGVRGPLLVYDVWEDRRRTDVDGRVSVPIAPRAPVVLSLRRRRRTPCVIGSTRHVVPGVDLLGERWDAGRRVLAARAVRLDDRPYAVTVALPPGFRPRQANSNPDSGINIETAGVDGQRAARLVIERPRAEEIAWEIRF